MTTSTLTTSPGNAAILTPLRLVGFIGLTSLALIAGAWYFQLVVGLVPCKLCLEQRLPHYAAIGLALVGAILSRSARLQWLVLLGLAGLMAWSTGLGIYHAGVEWGWFLGPSDCGGGIASAGGVQDLMKQLQTVKIVSCAEAAWRFLGLSLAGWNAVASAALFGLAVSGLLRSRRG
ncbi:MULTISPECIES: disulfide bond formation protein B [unclassified Bosea (in: a-proteobacteria)]|uniref:disulfide bond formation protein B n=1 Tax=unclassified Bosea (in: a-proteobacteria) TaxID=2653178 RepID=UPI000955E112|nr:MULTISPECIES: disulfide bond formation protein B [unclassified Bosea (in: a-proteobacteria)]TAJ29715.1 MAG: disulfide bond formation protein B [Bosea sp. (in: a-proteobacteria)]SIQ58285.1 Disulfide bond formation protein DsbB [Bosea sp. TND4EK4]